MKIGSAIIKIIKTAVVLLVVVLAVLLFLSKPIGGIGLSVYSVQSGSMEPSISVGSLVFVRSAGDYKEGDVITFRSEVNTKNTVTHRIVKVERDDDIGKLSYFTKGDANEEADPEGVTAGRVVGKVFLDIPLLGYAVAFAKTQVGFTLLVIVPAALIIYSEAISIKNELIKKFKKKEVLEEVK